MFKAGMDADGPRVFTYGDVLVVLPQRVNGHPWDTNTAKHTTKSDATKASSMASSPLARLGSKNPGRQYQLCQPGQSSPLSTSPSPTYNVQARRKRQYKSQTPSRSSLPTASLLSTFEDTPQKQFLRNRFKAHCLERARKGRGRTVQTAREVSFAAGSSSDGFDMDDDGMDDGDENVLNDEV
jgi:hypothetical protein